MTDLLGFGWRQPRKILKALMNRSMKLPCVDDARISSLMFLGSTTLLSKKQEWIIVTLLNISDLECGTLYCFIYK